MAEREIVGIVGLGLIGASFAKALSAAGVVVRGADIRADVVERAYKEKTIAAPMEKLSECSTLVIALYPAAAIQYLQEHAGELTAGTLVCDLCGVKKQVYAQLKPICDAAGATYIGAHPMAGKECWGYEYSDAGLFQGASMILTPAPGADVQQVDRLRALCIQAGFARTVEATPEEHDRIIAYTSQLAHIVSGAYMKSPTAERHDGFSAGSYRDLTRVAKLNEEMWTELFMANCENLSAEISDVICHLQEYQKALDQKDETRLKALLREARERKEQIG